MRASVCVAAIALAATPAGAHDFWLQPLRFTIPEPASVPLLIYVGHGPARERWGVSVDRVVLFRTLGPDGLVNRMANLTLDGLRVDATVRLAQPGAYVFGFQSRPATSDLPALRFDQYVVEDGITPIRANRAGAAGSGREAYSRRAKAIVQVGPIDAASIAQVTRPLGLSLEIVPERHPAMIAPGARLPLRVLYKGRWLPGALVKLTNLDADEKPVAVQRTDRAGRTAIVIPKRGQWQLNVVWADVLPAGGPVDYATTFSSLTFGSRPQ